MNAFQFLTIWQYCSWVEALWREKHRERHFSLFPGGNNIFTLFYPNPSPLLTIIMALASETQFGSKLPFGE